MREFYNLLFAQNNFKKEKGKEKKKKNKKTETNERQS
jgi:hypothetical protein